MASDFPVHVTNLSEDALIWSATRKRINPIPGLTFSSLRFRGDLQNPAGMAELRRQAQCLGNVIRRPDLSAEFGLITASEAAKMGVEAGLPRIQSIRSSRRIGPDGQVAFDLVAEVTQLQTAVHRGHQMPFLGGATVILGPQGQVRYVISKSVVSPGRLASQKAFVDSEAGQALWEPTRGRRSGPCGITV